MTIRAKFQLQEIRQHIGWSPTTRTLVFRPQYDTSTPEDQRFCKATPSGEFTMLVDNPLALANLELGRQYYFDINPVESLTT